MTSLRLDSTDIISIRYSPSKTPITAIFSCKCNQKEIQHTSFQSIIRSPFDMALNIPMEATSLLSNSQLETRLTHNKTSTLFV